jgi:hypothetical protein
MDISNLQEHTTFKDLLDVYGQERIMEFYFGESISFKKKFINPFRRDNTPGCTFFYNPSGKLIFRDFAKGSFDCFDIAGMRTGLEKSELIHCIASDMGSGQRKQWQHESYSYSPTAYESIETSIECAFTPFIEKDFQYWAQFGINEETLNRYEVKRVSQANINGKTWYLKNALDVCYQYTNEGRVKLYRPFARKEKKFRNNYIESTLPGYERLPERGAKLFITKAEKDMMTLATMGANALSLKSETSTNLPQDKVDSIMRRFDRIYVWLDADTVGRHRTEVLENKYGFIPLYHDASFGKDLSDIYKNVGKEKFKQIANSLNKC